MFFLSSRPCAGKSELLVGGLLLHSVGMSLNAQSQRTPEDYSDATKCPSATVQNTNPNYAKLKEYGRIEWHGDTATLFAGNVRPLDEVAHTLSHVSAFRSVQKTRATCMPAISSMLRIHNGPLPDDRKTSHSNCSGRIRRSKLIASTLRKGLHAPTLSLSIIRP